MRFQHKWQDVAPEEVPAKGQANLEATVLRALEAGVNHFEVARGYGSAEMQLGWALKQVAREDYILQTKVPPTKNPADFLPKFDQSMGYLGVDSVDLLGIHGLNDQQQIDWALQKGGALDQAIKLKEQGRVKHIGLSTHAPPEQVLPLLELGVFEYVNLHWYYIYPWNEVLIKKAHEKEMGVLIISPNDKGGKLQFPSEKMSGMTAPLSPMEFNDLYTLARPEVHTLSIGAAVPSDFDEHLKAVGKLQQAQQWLEPIVAKLEAAQLEALGPQWMGNWWEGIKPYYKQPGQVNVTEILRFWVYHRSLGLEEFAKARYNMFGKAGHWFPGNKAVEIDKKQMADHLAGHPLTDEILDILDQAHQTFDDQELTKSSGPRNSNDKS